MPPQTVLITGAYGLIGNVVYRRLAQQPEAYTVYGLARRRHPSDRISAHQLVEIPNDRLFLVNLADGEGMRRAAQDMDVVVHMAADPDGASAWESVLANNIVGAYHMFEASRLTGVKRIIFASTIQVSFGYEAVEPYGAIQQSRYQDIPDDIPLVAHDRPTRPLNLYAGSKVWGEAMAHMYAYAYGISCLCLRIGWVVAEDRPPHPYSKSAWCSQRDIAQLVERCIQAPPGLRFDIFYGVSDNRYRWVDVAHARDVLGYVPQDRAEDWA